MDELNLSLTPSSLHAPSFLFDSPNAVANAPSFLLPTEYSPYRESVVLPVMPQTIRIRLAQSIEIGTVSDESGTTLDDEKLICPYEYEFALVGLIPLFVSDSPLNALLPDG